MQLKRGAFWVGAALVLISAACGPVGPAFGLGPALDPFAGLLLLVALVLGGGWIVNSAVRSPAGQAIKRQFSETERAVRDRFRAGTEDRSASSHDEGDTTSRDNQIVRERYARGEIDRKQYLEMLADLKSR
jgi:hypothetical protein